MPRVTLPAWLKRHSFAYDPGNLPLDHVERIKFSLSKYKVDEPEVSIVIPAYNEETSLLNTLSTIGEFDIPYPTELLVVNNNSKDRTQEILDILDVRSVFQPEQGIKHARQMGLEEAKGKIVLQADADSMYPPTWGTDYVEALMHDPKVMMVYGRHSIIPGEGTSRAAMAMYEGMAGVVYKLREKNREYINVLGFNSAFRRDDALYKGSYEHTPQGSEDGHMAMTLMQHGKLKLIGNEKNRVWTCDRRLAEAGSFSAAFWKRFKREGSRVFEYIRGDNLPDDELPQNKPV